MPDRQRDFNGVVALLFAVALGAMVWSVQRHDTNLQAGLERRCHEMNTMVVEFNERGDFMRDILLSSDSEEGRAWAAKIEDMPPFDCGIWEQVQSP